MRANKVNVAANGNLGEIESHSISNGAPSGGRGQRHRIINVG